MNRRNFFASLLALPLLNKLKISAKPTRPRLTVNREFDFKAHYTRALRHEKIVLEGLRRDLQFVTGEQWEGGPVITLAEWDRRQDAYQQFADELGRPCTPKNYSCP